MICHGDSTARTLDGILECYTPGGASKGQVREPEGNSAGTRLTPEQGERRRRRIDRLRKGGLFDPPGPTTVIERAVTIEDLTEAYALVHDVFCEQGFMRPSQGGVRIRPFEAFPEMATFVARVDGKIVAVTSMVPDSPDMGLPSDHVYHDELDRLRREPGTVCEITNLAIASEHRNRPLFLQLTQAIFAHAWACGCGNMFISVSPSHTHFFHDVCQFEHWGSRRSYSDEVEDIVEGMRLCVPTSGELARETDRCLGPGQEFVYAFYYTGNLFHDRVKAWAIQAQETFDDHRMLQNLFILRSRFLLDCTDDELEAVRCRWDDRVFWSVWGEDESPSIRRSTTLRPRSMTRAELRMPFVGAPSPAR